MDLSGEAAKSLFEHFLPVALREETFPGPSRNEVIVKTAFSAISAGTELLVYRGQAPADLVRDTRLEALSGTFSFPLKYGYAAVGEVVSLGPGVDLHWEGKRVFSFSLIRAVLRPPCRILFRCLRRWSFWTLFF